MSAKVKRGTVKGETEKEFPIRNESLLIILLNLWKNDEYLKSSRRDQHIIELYESGLSMKEVGLEFGISAQRVEQILKKSGVPTRKYTRSKRLIQAREKKRKVITKELLLKFYKDECLSISEITEQCGVSHASLYKSLEFYNIAKRNKQGIQRSTLTEELLRRLYLEENLTACEIAQKLGFAGITIKKRLGKFGIRKRDREA